MKFDISFIRKLFSFIKPSQMVNLGPDLDNTQLIQRQLFFYYQYLKNKRLSLPNFQDTGFRVYSQNDEDGLLLYIFSLIGFTNKICVDMAFASPYGANTTNLICNWGFSGLLIEGSDVTESVNFFTRHKDTFVYRPKIIKAWITAENVNDLCKRNNIEGEIDLFSLDLDGVDYWVWKSLNVIRPRVIILEYMNIFPASKSVTVPYKSNFNRFDIHPDFFGASLGAFVKLGKKKGYRLIGCNKYGFNAFFLRKDIGKSFFPEISVKECLKHPQAIEGNIVRLPVVEKLGWVEI